MNKYKRGFTLAEVLIVLAIIGIVTAIVLPGILDVGEDHIWEKQSNMFGAKLFTALKMMNFKGDLARLRSTEDFANNLKKYIKIVKICPNETAYQCFDKKISTGKDNEAPKSVEEMGLTTAANFGHEDWNNSNVVGLQFANGISALVAYNTKNCSPTMANAAENIWESDIFDCIAMMFDVNANATPNEIKKDIKFVNANGVGSASKKCVGDTCYAFVVPTEGVDCSNIVNVVGCNITGINYYTSYASNSDIKSHNRLVEAALMCNDIDMHLATKDELQNAVNDLKQDYFAQLASKYDNRRFFASKTPSIQGNEGVVGYDVGTNTFVTDSNNCCRVNRTSFVGVCISD